MDLKEQGVLGQEVQRHWYYVSKGRAILTLLRGATYRCLLDVGAGSGVFARLLLAHRVVDRAVCVDTGYPDDFVSSSVDGQISFVRSTDCRDCDLMLMVDVLEHVDDDVALVRQHVAHLPPGTAVVVTVPAFRFLWSAHDDYLGHKRRYTRRQLYDVLSMAGLSVAECRYFFAFILPAAVVTRVLARTLAFFTGSPPRSDLRHHSRLVNATMILLHDVERRFVFPLNEVGGLTVMAFARVPQKLSPA